MTASARQRPQASAAFAEASCRPAIVRLRICNCCGGQRPCLIPKNKNTGEEAATPKATSRADARFWMCSPGDPLSRITAATGSAAIIQQSQKLSRFAAHTLIQIVVSRNTKSAPPCAEAVDDVTSLWKTEEN